MDSDGVGTQRNLQLHKAQAEMFRTRTHGNSDAVVRVRTAEGPMFRTPWGPERRAAFDKAIDAIVAAARRNDRQPRTQRVRRNPANSWVAVTASERKAATIGGMEFDPHVCPNCRRDDTVVPITRHHLIPIIRGGKKGPMMPLCEDCHRFLNTQYTPAEQEQLSNPAALLADEKMARFGRFAARQNGQIKQRESRERRARRRR